MNWKIKAAVQRACAIVPIGKQALYRQIQCRCGQLEHGYDYSFLLSEAVRMTRLLASKGFTMEGASVMEVGTGWRMDIPIGFFLCGAQRIVTCDLNRYLIKSLALRTVQFILDNPGEIRSIFSSVHPTLLEDRLAALKEISTVEDLFAIAGIEYCAPCDCAHTKFASHSFDIHFSYTVFEHIPGPTLEAILLEANRLLKPGGVILHHIDLSDHFEQVDRSITKVNFLRFTEADWSRYAGTPWSYHNRLRRDEYREIFEKSAQDIVYWNDVVDQRSLECLRNGFPLAAQYRGLPAEALSTVIVDVMSRPHMSH